MQNNSAYGWRSVKLAIVNLTHGGLSRGYLKYLRHLVPLMAADPRIEHLQLLMPRGVRCDNMRKVETLPLHVGDSPWRHGRLRDQLQELAPDVVFFPTARWQGCGSIPTVVMVRNMEPMLVPFGGNPLLECAKNLGRAYMAWTACRHATRVIAVSQYVCDYLTAKWGVDARKIGVVYHGIEPPLDQVSVVRPSALESQGLEQFIFTAGSIRPARGLEDLIGALAKLRERGVALTLVIAGRVDSRMQPYFRRMQSLAEGLGVSSRIVWVGQLSGQEMSWCFYHCKAFVVTSRAEACPNTVLEAMRHGCQIVSTRQPPMPEFLAASALYYLPLDVLDLAEKLQLALEAPEEYEQTRRGAASARAESFKWEETARRTIEQLVLASSVAR